MRKQITLKVQQFKNASGQGPVHDLGTFEVEAQVSQLWGPVRSVGCVSNELVWREVVSVEVDGRDFEARRRQYLGQPRDKHYTVLLPSGVDPSDLIVKRCPHCNGSLED